MEGGGSHLKRNKKGEFEFFEDKKRKKCFKITYNTQTKSMRPSSMCFTIGVTHMLILVLSVLTILISVVYQQTKMHKERELWVYGVFLVIYTLGTCHSLHKLYRCARTDPGFIPSPKVLNKTILNHKSLETQRCQTKALRQVLRAR